MRTVVVRSSAIVIFLALWQFAPIFGWVDRTFLPPFTEVLSAWWDLAKSGELWTDVAASLTRSLSGFAIAVVIAVPVGLLIAWYKTLAEALSPLLTVFLNTAAVALLPVFVLILGIGETSKIAIIAYASFWPVLYNTIAGARNVDPLLVRSVRSLGVTGPRLFQKVVLPGALPTVFTGIRLAGATSILVLITTELVGAKAGLGYLISNSQYNFEIPKMFAGILTVAAVGVIFNQVLLTAERRVSRWRVDARG
ncbi:ABC transporter permease [Tsukamurella sp. 8F]|uniref:ABC transporter permease n=1 Tax=unclassified Tsukamurella TaxID=2633480 RepID=UPI0023B919C7|nr:MULTISPECIES: ABC transporter permease [unclassified Tsukamurella]MDF0530981.1 ABC transporter permease [Tsukamurella sp. 8J]MDF0588682.1 ABC transporter permease [Tsukamurella sp. 8F]